MSYITNDMLIKEYLDEKMIRYLIKKMPKKSQEDVLILACEVLKFLYFAGSTTGDIPFNQEVDDLWHLLIMQTKEYEQLMQKLPHKKFVHHTAHDYEMPKKLNAEEDRQEKNRQVSYLVSYVNTFGPFDENLIKYYKVALALLKIRNGDIAELNRYLLGLASRFRLLEPGYI